MEQYNIRDLLSYSLEQTMGLPETFILVFEDGSNCSANNKKLTYSSIVWDIVREYPNAVMNYSFYVESVLDGKPLGSNTHKMLIDNIYGSIIETYSLNTPAQKEHIWGLIYRTVSKLQYETGRLCDEYVTTIDILDFIEIVEHPGVKPIIDNVEDNYASIENCYTVVKDIVRNDPLLNKNAVAVAVRSGMVNINQVMQAVAVRGKLTEVDGTILPTGVLSNFTKGLTDLYEYAAESRSAAKSLYASDSKLQETEYTARRLQLLCMVVEKLAYEDCGSTKYLEWKVMPPTLDVNGDKVYAGDLKFMAGKYYLDPVTNQLAVIKTSDKHLEGKTLKLRSSLYCKHTDRHTVCEVCYGTLAKNISQYANLGHISVTTMTQQLTQSVLSTKHLDYSSSGVSIILNEVTSKYFKTNKSGTTYIVKDKFKAKNTRLVVSKDEVPGLTDIQNVENVETISPIRISAIEYVEFIYTDKGLDVTDMLFLLQGNKKVILSLDFIKYLKIHKWKVDNKNNIIFNLTEWDFSKPIFKLPEIEYSFSDHSALIGRVIESNMKNIRKRAIPGVAERTLKELFMLCNSKINVNLALLEIVIYACMIPKENEYNLSRNASEGSLGIARLCITNRSLGPAYTYEGQAKTMTNPRSFFKLDRPDSVFDVLMDPSNYLKHNPTPMR